MRLWWQGCGFALNILAKPLTPVSELPLATSPTVAEYFAGIGLIKLALTQAGWAVTFANDINPRKHDLYQAAFGIDSPYIIGNIFDLDPNTIPPTTLTTCCFPCIDLSLAGKQVGLHGRHSSAYWGFINILAAQGDNAPPLVLLENVRGWLTAHGGADFRLALQALNSLGYGVDVFELDALHVVPQSRPRVFVVATRPPFGSPNPAIIQRRPATLASSRLKQQVAANPNLVWGFLPIPTPPPLLTEGLTGSIIEALSDDDPHWWDTRQLEHHWQMLAPAHRALVERLRQAAPMVYRTGYRRIRQSQQRLEVRADDRAGCLRTALGGSSRQIVLALGGGQVKMRWMTPREYARLQGVPDSYPITVNERQALNGFGDAVCVPAVRWIAEQVLAPLVQCI